MGSEDDDDIIFVYESKAPFKMNNRVDDDDCICLDSPKSTKRKRLEIDLIILSDDDSNGRQI